MSDQEQDVDTDGAIASTPTSAVASAAEAAAEAEAEFDDGLATIVDPDALKKLRLAESAVAEADEPEKVVGSAPVARQSTSELLAVDAPSTTEFDEAGVTKIDPNAMRDAPDPAEIAGSEPCPKCGVIVAPGYPKCPRCHEVLQGESRREEVGPARQQASGGTTVVGRTVPWAIVCVMAIGTAIIVYLSEREPQVHYDSSHPRLEQKATPAPSESL